MPLFFSILLASLAESSISFAGGLFAIFGEERLKRATHFVVSFAVGALLSVAFLELIPEAIEMASVKTALSFVLGGIVLFFVIEKFLLWYHCHDLECPVHTYTYLILWGDFIHNFIDGVMIALAFLADSRLGWFTLVAVIAHEIPQEMSDFGIMIHGGFSRRKALWANFLVSLSTIAGAILTYVVGEALEPALPFALALVAGNFIYLAIADLMPELHETAGISHTLGQIVLMAFGILVVAAPAFLLE